MSALDSKIALITSGASGIGTAAAKHFRQDEAMVIVTGASAASVGTVQGQMAGIEGLVSNQGDPAAAKSPVDHGFISTPMGGELGLAPEQFADFASDGL